MRVNFEETDKAIATKLNELKRPIHYREARLLAIWSQNGHYSSKTDPDEKIRQYYGERCNGRGISFVKGGYLVLDHWFPSPQLTLLPPPEKVVIRGKCIVSYNAGYETAMRQPHYRDWHDDKGSDSRIKKQQQSALVEHHLKWFIKNMWHQFYRPASNEGNYEQYAVDDCSIVTPFHNLAIDAKKPSYENENGYDVTVIRNPHTKVIYVKGDLLDDETIIIEGIIPSSWVKMLGVPGKGTYLLLENYLWSIDILFVLLNMATQNLDYNVFYRNLKRG